MKYLRILLIAVITIITFGSARAQVSVGARVVVHPHRHYYRPHRYYHRRAYYHRPYGRHQHYYHRSHYRHY